MSTIKKLEKEIHAANETYLKPSPKKWNPAHAEVCPAISLELSTALVDDCINESRIQPNGDFLPHAQDIQKG